ncbi:MAG: hypothetical protein EPN84_03800 [Legionella sp.]|nr:MAG: hypothetical protein EPN84_03800 [Legionella sp.]
MISTLEQKAKDPIAAQIPHYIWKAEFKGKLKTDLIALNKPLDALTNNDLPRNGTAAFILLLIAYPHVSGKELYQFAVEELNLSFETIVSYSAIFGQLTVLKYIKECNSAKLKKTLYNSHSKTLAQAAANGQIATIAWFKKEYYWISKYTAKDQRVLIELAFNNAIRKGDVSTLEQFKQNIPLTLLDILIGTFLGQKQPTPEKLKGLIKKNNFNAFCLACENGRLNVIHWILEQFPQELSRMLQIIIALKIQDILNNGHLNVLIWLEQVTASYKFKNRFLQRMDSTSFMTAFNNGHTDICLWLLKFPACFAFAEQHQREFGPMVNQFVEDFLAELHEARRLSYIDNPNGVFNLQDKAKIRLAFYVLRNLIRRYPEGPASLHDDVLFLLEIPAIKSLAHRSVNANQGNELLRLALSVGNREASAVLFAIPSVENLAAQHNYYRSEAQGNLDLRDLANDSESAMKVLTSGEKKRLAKLLAQYEPQVQKKGGVARVMNNLRATLTQRYQAEPALYLSDKGVPCPLPVEYADFIALNLSSAEKKRALKAYYENKNHTALRYISKPNHWMHQKASYVYINDERTERWSTFEEYQSLIATFYLAAIDKKSPAIDGHTIPGRLTHFIHELALIGRAHNWDQSRIKKDAKGKVIKNRQNQPVYEQFDDLTGDKPSCLSGVKRRLFQSLIGHSLFAMLTGEKVEELLIDLVREYFKLVLEQKHSEALDVVLNCLATGDDIPDAEYDLLSSINIPTEAINTFIVDLESKYGDSAFDFLDHIKDKFLLPEDNDKPELRNTHLVGFYYKARLENLFAQTQKHSGFFANGSGKPSQALFLGEVEDPDWDSEFDSTISTC